MRISSYRLNLEMARMKIGVEELSKLSNVSLPALTRIRGEKQAVRPKTLGKLAEALGVDPAKLLDNEGRDSNGI